MTNARDSSLVDVPENSPALLSDEDIEDDPKVVESYTKDPDPLGPSIEDRSVTFKVVEHGTKRNAKKLISSDGYSYTVKIVTTSTTNWRCSVRNRTTSCKATIIQKGKEFVQGASPHNHPNDPGFVKEINMIKIQTEKERDSHLVDAPEISIAPLSNEDIKVDPEVVESYTKDPDPLGLSIEDRSVTFKVVEHGTKRYAKKLISSDGYSYTVKIVTSSTTNWRCSVRNKTTSCKATVIQKGQDFVQGASPHNHPNDPGFVKEIKIQTEIKCNTAAATDADEPLLHDGEEIILTGIDMVYLHEDKRQVTGKITITNKKLYFKSKEQVKITILFCEIFYINGLRSATKQDEKLYEIYHVILKKKDHEVTLMFKFATQQQNDANQVYQNIKRIAFSNKQYIVGEKSSKAPERLAVQQPTISQSKRKTDDDNLPPPKRNRRKCSRSTMKFLGRKIAHEWILKDQSKKWCSGLVTAVLKKSDGDADAVYEVKYDGEDGAYELRHKELLEDYRESSLKFIEIQNLEHQKSPQLGTDEEKV